MNYVVNIQDRIAQNIFNNSRKLTELRILVCMHCKKEIELLNEILENQSNVLKFDRF